VGKGWKISKIAARSATSLLVSLASGTADTGQQTADSALSPDDAWQEASTAAKIIGTFPDSRRRRVTRSISME